MTAWGFTADLEELNLVATILGNNSPSETEGEGVWVHSVNGGRRWTVSTHSLMWEVYGDPVELPIEARCIPTRAVWEARIFAITSSNHEATFSIPDDIVCLVTSEVGTTVIDLPPATEPPSFPMYVANSASAKTTVGALSDLLFRARIVPLGPSNDEYPDAKLFIDELGISIFVDWTERRALRSTYRIPAEVTGEASCSVMMGLMYDLVRDCERDQELTVLIPEQIGMPVQFESGLFRATIDCISNCASRHHEELVGVLAGMDRCQTRMVDAGTFILSTPSRELVVELTDRPDETVSVRTEVCRDVPLSMELLAQINDTNAALVGSRLWTVDGVVWAGLDLPVSALNELEQAIRSLDHQLTGFDVFLSGFSAA